MSKERIKISEDLYDIMPSDYQDLVKSATYGKEDRGWKDIGNSKELIEQHSLCAGCPESMAFRYILASLPNPEDTVMVGSTGCTSLVFPMVAVHNIHSLFGNQNAIASGLKRALSVRFPGRTKDVVVLAGDGATVGRPAMASLGRFVAAEAALALLILLITTALSLSPPAVHDAIRWPFALRLSWEAAAQVPGGPARFLIGAQVAVVGLLAMIVGLLLRPWRVVLFGAGGVALVTGLWVALPPLSVDAYPTTYRRSSVPYQAASIAGGATLYRAHCATCHGPGGRGVLVGARRDERRQVQHRVHVGHRALHGAEVADVAPGRLHLPSQLPRRLARGGEVEVEGADLVPLAEQLRDGVGADVSERAGEQDLHGWES